MCTVCVKLDCLGSEGSFFSLKQRKMRLGRPLSSVPILVIRQRVGGYFKQAASGRP